MRAARRFTVIGGLGHLAVKLRLCVLRHRYRRGCLHPLWLTGAAINMEVPPTILGSGGSFRAGIESKSGLESKEQEMSGRSAAW